nr:hypothetical protein [uncultured archaeon]
MNKKALVGKLIFLALVVAGILGAFAYVTFSKSNFQFKTGDVTINVDIEKNETMEEPRIIEVPENETDAPANYSLNITNISE